MANNIDKRNGVTFYLNPNNKRNSICRFCKKPYGKYHVEHRGATFDCCNTCLAKALGDNFEEKMMKIEAPKVVEHNNGYIVSAFKQEKDKITQVFLGIDSYSGGYPYWTNDIGSAKAFYDKEKAHNEVNFAFSYRIGLDIIPNSVTIYSKKTTYVKEDN